MDNLMIELDYIKSHFPNFMVDLIPKIIIGTVIVQIILLFILLSVRKAETDEASKKKSVVLTISFILWAVIAVLVALYIYYYMKLGL